MAISTDYESDCARVFKDISEDLSPIMNGDTVIKTVRVQIDVQSLEPGTLWGQVTRDRSCLAERRYPSTTRTFSDAEIVANLQKELEHSHSNRTQGLEGMKEALELLSCLELSKYPTLLASLHKMAQTELDDKTLLDLISSYQQISTTPLSHEDPAKLCAKTFSERSPQSPEVQNKLALMRQKIKETPCMELAHEMHAHLSDTLRLLIAYLEGEEEKSKGLRETLQLPADSEQVRALIAPIRDRMLGANKQSEAGKVSRCYSQAVEQVKQGLGEKRLSCVNVKLLYTKTSAPGSEFVYEKKFANRP